MPIPISFFEVKPIVCSSREHKEVLDFNCLIGFSITSRFEFEFRQMIKDHLLQLELRRENVIKFKLNGVTYTASHPENLDFILEPPGNIKVDIYPPAEILSFENDFSEIKREVTLRIKNNLKGTLPKNKIPYYKNSPEEEKALQSLRDLISEKEYRKYLTNGYILVSGKEDFTLLNPTNKRARGIQGPLVYQVFKDQRHTKVYSKGRPLKEICIHSEGCPPTDHVINIMKMVEYDESELWEAGNLYEVPKRYTPSAPVNDDLKLIDFYKECVRPSLKKEVS